MATPEDRDRGNDIAVIGMACVFPGADGPDQFWRNIRAKKIQIGDPQPEWRAERYVHAVGPTHISSPAGGYLGDLYRFDPAELGVMPNSIDGGEPDQFLALRVARDALADAGCLTNYNHTNTGIVLGHSTYLHRGSANSVQHGLVVDQTVELVGQLFPNAPSGALDELRAELVARLPPFNADIAPALVPNVMTGRIANRFDLRGPNYLIDAACASSLLAVKAAVEELRSGRSDLMLAGGVNASIPSVATMVFTQLGALSQSSRVSPFDAAADGTLLGEGLGIVVLKRLNDACAAGDRIYAVIKGIGQSSDGKGAGLLAPLLQGEVLAIRRAYEDAGVEPESVGLVEAHGTGIPLGDRTEIGALRETFGPRDGDLPRIALGAIKSMIGHCIPAAGIAGLIKTALALHYRILPPTVCGEVSEALGIDETQFYVNTEARPWVASPKTRRRAGVNAFGFGGINSHAVLEEAPEPAEGARPVYLAAELVVLSAPDHERLIAVIDELQNNLAGRLSQEPLAAVAAALAAKDIDGAVRLAIVAEDLADLTDKLGKAREHIVAGGARVRLRSGIYCSDEIRDGKVAFVFPGEGSQYEGMLSDLIEAFPEARHWFDFWDGLYGAGGDRPSECVFPPPKGLGAVTKERLRNKLFGLEMGSESALVASQALLAVTRRLGLCPDVMVGHSSGEHAALFAAGALRWRDWDDLEFRLQEIKRLYYAMEQSAEVPGGALLTVGAAPRQRVIELAEQDQIHIALDNCEQQMVLYGQRSQLESVAAQLGREGGLCAFLPFSRPYHTPLFSPNADLDAIYQKLDFQSPTTPLYSCATAAPMPATPDDIRELVVGQWRSRVRFSETIERMYADGVRTFVEVGASAKLTGFIDNILHGKKALNVALNSHRRSSLVQLLHSLGRLWSAGISFDIRKLFDGRSVVPSVLTADRPTRRRDRVFANTLPFVEIPATALVKLRAALAPQLSAAPPASPEGTISARAFSETAPASSYPFLDRIVSHDANKLLAECDLDLRRHGFLRQHCLYATHVSDLNPELTGLPVVPLAVSMEMLAEVASAAVSGLVPIRLEQLRAHNWIALDDGPRTIGLEAVPLSNTDEYVRVSARIRDDTGMPLVEAVVVLAEAARSPPAADLQPAPLIDPQPSIGRDDELYLTGMFHGPLFQSVAAVAAWDATGLDACLAHTPLDDFFEAGKHPALLLNPVLLDAVGHVTAFWIGQYLGTNFSCFPSSIEAIDLYDAVREDTQGSYIAHRVGADQSSAETSYLNSEFTCFDGKGAPLFRATGWRDRFFEVPTRFFYARFQPRDGFYGEEVSGLFVNLPDNALVWRVPAFECSFLDDAGGIWRRVLSNTVLSAEERLEWKALSLPQPRRDEWLIGRIAIKEAARAWIESTHGVRLLPADIVVRVAAGGKPYISGEGLESFGEMPEVSMAHVASEAVAIAAPPGTPVGIDLDTPGRIATDDLLAAGFSASEQAILMDSDTAAPLRVLQAWCAKEAAAKCLGTGLNGQPKLFVVSALDDQHGWSRVVVPGDIALSVSLAVDDQSILAVAYADQARGNSLAQQRA
jgi:acyl transferase domain-containing protein/phosphopantetheinyl transferase